MTNRDFIMAYIKGKQKYNAYCHLAYKGNTLWNYSTIICEVDRESKTANLNVRKYSRTTSAIQSRLQYELESAGYTITTYEGDRANLWGGGYQSVMTCKKSEVKDFQERRTT